MLKDEKHMMQSVKPAGSLGLDPVVIARARELAGAIARPVLQFVRGHSTVAIERAVLRLLGVNGADPDGAPLANLCVDLLSRPADGSSAADNRRPALERGAAWWYANAALATGRPLPELAAAAAEGQIDILSLETRPDREVREFGLKLAREALNGLDRVRRRREALTAACETAAPPYLYVIVATGNIHEDLIQARAAARQGADIIAVIRSTGQSLLDYVPHGATTEGYGGTYATQENFRLMRENLDGTSRELGRYIRLVNYSSGLCMPEIAALGALEGLDMMLNDAMYGVLFRDISMKRTLIDQHFSRMILARAGIIINTGEDNYLTTADAVEAAHTVLASQFINERFAREAGLPDSQTGLGHAFQIDPWLEDGFLFEIAQARMAREIFPGSPLKYMPPTRHMNGNIFFGHVYDAMFNLASVLTGQTIHLVGMLTEAIHTPFLHDRFLSIENARYLKTTAAGLADEIEFRPDGKIRARAAEVLARAVALLEDVERTGLMAALQNGVFADIRRSPDGGRGREGVFPRSPGYYNPFFGLLDPGNSPPSRPEEGGNRP